MLLQADTLFEFVNKLLNLSLLFCVSSCAKIGLYFRSYQSIRQGTCQHKDKQIDSVYFNFEALNF